jgi:hypothetical protein
VTDAGATLVTSAHYPALLFGGASILGERSMAAGGGLTPPPRAERTISRGRSSPPRASGITSIHSTRRGGGGIARRLRLPKHLVQVEMRSGGVGLG